MPIYLSALLTTKKFDRRSHGVEFEAIWALAARQNLLVRKLAHRRDTLEEIFLKAMGHLAHTPGERAGLEAGQG